MSKELTSIEAALAALSVQVIPHLRLYKVNEPGEAANLPQALWTSRDELRALELMIYAAPLLRRLVAGICDERTTVEDRNKLMELGRTTLNLIEA
jgi:hypothetical protein